MFLHLIVASFTRRLLRYVFRTVLVYVQNAPGILVRFRGLVLLYCFKVRFVIAKLNFCNIYIRF